MTEAKWNATVGNGKEPASEKQVTWIAGDVLEWLCPGALCIQASSSTVDNISSNTNTHTRESTGVELATADFLCKIFMYFCAGDKQARPSTN